ncbi:MAG TPA: 3-hydroxyacyl-CoA dehydrogenase family protein [Gemmatimonadales bacterium]|nr:3-hydroxyacyl-CoA dehydrogenase family protein [Gemmatimonadales bacterium]
MSGGATEVRTVAVVGAGTMGRGIAQVAAQAGYAVRLADAVPSAAAVGVDRIRANLEGGVARGKLTAAARDQALARITVAAQVGDAVRGADLVIEAVPEDLELKRELFARFAAEAPAAVLATNTSSLPVAAIAAATPAPERVLGMHFFNPVHLMKLVEVVTHDATGAATRDLALAAARRMGKEPIVVRDAPGFASSRLGVALGLEAIRMVEDGVASPEDIDRAMTLGYNHPVGPLRLTDLVGLDVRLAIARHLERTLGARYAPPALLVRMVAEGKLGRKSGQGFYRWTDGAAP